MKIKFRDLKTCPLCHSTDQRPLFPVHGTVLQQCHSCGFKYLDPCITDESMALIYQSSEHLSQRCSVHEVYYEYGDLERPTKTLRDYQQGVGLLEKYLNGMPKSLFEVGFGSGLFLAAAKKTGWQVDGVDTSSENVNLAAQKFDLSLKQGNLYNDSIPAESFSAAAAWDVLEHQPNPNEFLQKLKAILKPGGLLLIAVPNDFSFLTLLSSFLYSVTGRKLDQGLKKFYVLEHIGYYNRRTLQRILQQNGFELVYHFFTSTDLARYHFSFFDRFTASIILFLGKIFCLQNRVIVLARKSA